MTTFKQYLLNEVDTYIQNVEDKRACKLDDNQVDLLVNTVANVLCEDEWLCQQIMERISEEYERYIEEV